MKPTKWLLAGATLALISAAHAADSWTLERALQQALANNPDARLARSRIQAAEASLQQANSAFWPRLQFESSYVRTDNPMRVFGGILNQRAFPDQLDFNNVPDSDNLNTRGILTVPLYTGGRNKSAGQAAKAGAAAVKEDEQAVRNALGFEVSRAFYTVIKAREFVRAAEASVRAFETNLSIARRRHEAGSLLKTDVLDLQVRLAQAQEDLVRAKNASALSLRSLGTLLGIEQEEIEITENAEVVAAPLRSHIADRAELAAAKHREEAAENELRGARGGWLPRLSAFGSADYDYGWEFDHGGGSYTAGGLLQWDLWDGNETRGKVKEAAARLDAAREESRKLRLSLDLELEEARLDLKAANERLRVTEEMILHARESAELTRSRFDQGVALSSQVVDAEVALLGVQVRRAEAEADQRIAVAALRKALGMPQIDVESTTETK